MGTIIKTEAGSFHISVHKWTGERVRKTFERRSAAEAFISKIENEKHQRKLVAANLKIKRILFTSAISEFQISKSQLRPKTISKYKFIFTQFEKFITALDIVYVDEFTPDNGTLLRRELMRGKNNSNGEEITASPKTINGFMSVIKALFKDEVNKGHINRSPLQHLNNLKEESPRPEYYTSVELRKFFAVDMKEEYSNAFLALLYTGMRFSELANITWEDVDLHRNLIYVRRKDGFNIKTNNSERAIPINDPLREILVRVSENMNSEMYPFCSAEGKQLRERKLLAVCKGIGEKAGITNRVFLHKFRHTFATILVQKKTPIESLQKLMGHASINETMVYVHVRSEDLHSEVNTLNNIL